ncbi:sulfate adenylyltransferase subunit 1 [Pseudorhodoferax aquiterrae]|uniref:sulfate adenylyltransferase n=1 Tax=Pseudorhodoferax aquiterrae TaxID=747304 RepID=A0ABQ3G910_9BURK|nr:GTP-binding protein [Pseudorhodoferax aquiterrae]GHC95979.1 sulfate adenylyltransferase subunit 1 [Pseudorhodoferax aquiterrae]
MTATLEHPVTTAANDAAPTAALKFITCGSVDDGKSTLIGRLLVDSKAVLSDQLAGVQRQGQDGRETDLALLTDGLSAEREQGITIDVAYRYFSTTRRKFIIGDTPGHEQYTRNMVTAASSADAAVLLVDATKLAWQDASFPLLAQTRRHALLVQLLRVPAIVFAVNKLDAVADPKLAYTRIEAALRGFAAEAGIAVEAIVPVSALKGWNVVDPAPSAPDGAHWCGYHGPSLLRILEGLSNTPSETGLPLAFPVQWVEKFSSSSDTSQGRRVFWGRVATGQATVGQRVRVLPSGQSATIARVLSHVRQEGDVAAGHSAGIVLDREVDVSRGDWLLAQADDGTALQGARELSATIAWMDDEPLVPGRAYWALHGHRWVKAKVRRIVHKLDIHTLAEQDAAELEANAIGEVELVLQDSIATLPYRQSRTLGALVLVDQASHKTAAAVLVR